MLKWIKPLGFFLFCALVLLTGERIKALAVSSMGIAEDSDELIIDDQVFEMVLRGAEQNQTLLFSASYSCSSTTKNRGEIERIIVMEFLPALRILGYHDLGVQIYDEDQGQVDKYMQGEIDEATLKNSVPFLEEICGIQILKMARELGFKVWAIDPTYLYEGNCLLLFFDIMAGNIDALFFENLKKNIFNEDMDAKVVCILAGPYISEAPGLSDYPLGMRLDEFTNGRNFSVSIEGPEYPNGKIVSDIKIHIDGDTFLEAKRPIPHPHPHN